jgi:CelD/BcsL family acetyltransferase involved in cellulose biosynthesis
VHPSVEYVFLRTTEELCSFAPAWQRLWDRDPNALPFQSPAWLVPWWKQFGTEELCALVIVRKGEATGLLPFYVYRDTVKRQGQLLPLGVGTTDYLDGVFAPECSVEEIGGAVELLRSEVPHDVFCASQLREQSRFLEALKQRSGNRDQGSEAVSRDNMVFMSQSDGCSRMPAARMAELPQKIRRNAMYYRNRAQRCGTLELVQADESNWQDVFSELRQLHTIRWQTRGEDGVLVDERVVQWHHEAIPLLLRAGLLRLMALKLNQKIIAALYSLIDRERDGRAQYFYITAYSPEHADLRPGTLLIAYAVEQAANEGVTAIDMLRGDEGYKQIWHMEKAPTWCVTQFAAASSIEHDCQQTAVLVG